MLQKRESLKYPNSQDGDLIVEVGGFTNEFGDASSKIIWRKENKIQ